MRARIAICFFILATAATVYGVDRPIAVGVIRSEDPSSSTHLRKFAFRVGKQPAIQAATLPDPTVAGASLRVFGTGAGDGDTGVLSLPAEGWKRLRNGGYYYRDHSAANGVSQVRIVPRGGIGGHLHIGGRTETWGFDVTQPQTALKMHLTIAGDTYCAHITNLQPNRDGITMGRKAPAPADCN